MNDSSLRPVARASLAFYFLVFKRPHCFRLVKEIFIHGFYCCIRKQIVLNIVNSSQPPCIRPLNAHSQVSLCVCMRACVRVCILHARTYVCIHVCMYVCVCICMYVCIMHSLTHARTHARTHVHTYACTYVCM